MHPNLPELKPYSLHDMMTEDKGETRVFVINNSQFTTNTFGQGGDVVLPVTLSGGAVRMVVIPKTWIPFDISTLCSRKFLEEDFDLRKSLNSNLLVLVNPKQAIEILATPKAQRELARLSEMTASLDTLASIKAQHLPEFDIKPLVPEVVLATSNNEDVVVKPSPFVLDIMSRETISDDARLASLEGEIGHLTAVDCAYVISASKSTEEIKALMGERMTALQI